MPEGLGRNDQGGSSLYALRSVRLRALSSWHGADSWSLWHARHRSARRSSAPGAGRLDRRRRDDDGTVGENSALSISPLAPASTRRRTRAWQRRAVGTRRQGFLLSNCAALV